MFSSAHPYAHFLRLWLTVLALLVAWPTQAAFIDHGDGTLTDTLTGLMWDKCSSGQSGRACASGSASTHSWAAAQSLAESANAAAYRGHNDWRLPNVSELESLVKIDASNPAIDSSAFPNTQSYSYDYWSSTLYTPDLASAWVVHFGNGGTYAVSQSYHFHVRLVRSGQSFDSLATQPSVSFVSSFISADEASRSAIVIVTRSAATAGGVATVRYVTVNGSAEAGIDYTATSGLLYWAAGEGGPKSIVIPLTDDLLVKGTRWFSVLLSDPTGTLISGASSATIEISDNDHNTPDPFSFTPQTGVALNTTITSNPITVRGINTPVSIAVINGSYSVNALPFVNIIGSVNNSDTVLVNILSASTAGAVRTAMLTIGGVSAGFTVTTGSFYDITSTANPTRGGTASCTPNQVTHGGSSTCTAIPATGYSFTGWSGDCAAGSGAGSCSLSNITAAKSVTANFMASSTSNLSAAPGSPTLPGQITTLTAQVSSMLGTPTGNVAFKEGGMLLGTAALNNGAATYQAGIFGVGTHSLSARYEGNTIYHYSEGNLNYQVAEKIDSTLAVRTRPNSSQPGDSVPVTVTVTPLNNVGALSGSIEVSSDGQNCHITLPAVSCTLVFASKGVKKLTATYSGNSLYTPASGSGIHFVGKHASLAPILMLLLD
jgi:hypothetical protein